ncbi:hypothetical protein PoB_001681000 [Plakobranchus ocellatus]|uniref:Uncharacterized protein n=1 Tax=Plakobranchus ocellatus TaxID=259542 RepID=A0AAV3Z4C3_9GAST|nr:hypothetical protein PoB_001681000 [Plakobranchus ocellatus]
MKGKRQTTTSRPIERHKTRDQSQLQRIARATCPRTTIVHKDKEVGRKEGGGWGRLTQPDRSRMTRKLPIAAAELILPDLKPVADFKTLKNCRRTSN